MLKRITILSLMLGLLSTGLLAAEKDYTPAKKPEHQLEKDDLDLIAKLKKNHFKGLTNSEKDLLLKYLKDYANSAKHEKGFGSKKISDKKSKASAGKKKPSLVKPGGKSKTVNPQDPAKNPKEIGSGK